MSKAKEYYVDTITKFKHLGYNRGKNGGDIEISEIEFKEC
jgi:hypothetical protein